jgi:thymidylate synthase
MLITADTLDDLLRRAFEKIVRDGTWVTASRGRNRELCCVLLKLTNPLARLSHTEKRGKVFSALGELAWYLAGSKDAKFITYYIDRYKEEIEHDGSIHGGYGPRVFSNSGIRQFDTVINLLRTRPSSRKAVIQLFDPADLRGDYKDVPCTCSLQLMVRDDQLHMSAVMRSNDAYYGLPHDIFCFTMIQELAARTLGCELGSYSHYAGSFHIYEGLITHARKYLEEGWQDAEFAPMPRMPDGDPWRSVRTWLDAEKAIRAGRRPAKRLLAGLDDYWTDLVRLLQVFRYSVKTKKPDEITRLKGHMKHPVYKEYIAQKGMPGRTSPRSGQPELFPPDEAEDDAEVP